MWAILSIAGLLLSKIDYFLFSLLKTFNGNILLFYFICLATTIAITIITILLLKKRKWKTSTILFPLSYEIGLIYIGLFILKDYFRSLYWWLEVSLLLDFFLGFFPIAICAIIIIVMKTKTKSSPKKNLDW